MHQRFVGMALGMALLALAGIAPAQVQPTAPAKTIDELVVELGDPSFPKRERATRELWSRGSASIPALERAKLDTDPEVSKRATGLLDKFAWGILPDTPADVLALIRKYQAGGATPKETADSRRKTVEELLAKGKSGIAAVHAILLQPLTAEIRAVLVEQVSGKIRREVPRLLFDGKPDEAAILIALHSAGTTPEGAADYAVYQVLHNTLNEAITTSENELKAGQNPASAKLVLAHLYRASGDWERARTMAVSIPVVRGAISPVERLREEAGDFGYLADNPPMDSNLPDALNLTYLRLAGRGEDFDKATKRLRASVEELASREEIKDAALALLANNKAFEATELLLDKQMHLGLLAELLIAQMRYKEALELTVGKMADPDQIRDKSDSDLRRARVLAYLGKRDDAVQVFNGLD